jgi:hypothetical protein
MLMPGLPAQPVIHLAIGRRQVTMTDCNEQSVISQLQSAQSPCRIFAAGSGARCPGRGTHIA